MFRNNYVERKKAKKKKPRSEETKRKISESLSGRKFGSYDFPVNPRDAQELLSTIRQGESFKYQELIDWYRDLKR